MNIFALDSDPAWQPLPLRPARREDGAGDGATAFDALWNACPRARSFPERAGLPSTHASILQLWLLESAANVRWLARLDCAGDEYEHRYPGSPRQPRRDRGLHRSIPPRVLGAALRDPKGARPRASSSDAAQHRREDPVEATALITVKPRRTSRAGPSPALPGSECLTATPG